MQNIILTQLTTEQLQSKITEAVTTAFFNMSAPTPEEVEYITRKEAAQFLSVSLVTLNQWTKEGIIQGYRIGTRVRYKKNEVLNSLTKVKGRRL